MCAVSKLGWLQAGTSLSQWQDIGSQRHTQKKTPNLVVLLPITGISTDSARLYKCLHDHWSSCSYFSACISNSLAHRLLYRQVIVQKSKSHCSAVDWPCVLSVSQNTQQKQLKWEQIIFLAHRLGDKVHHSGRRHGTWIGSVHGCRILQWLLKWQWARGGGGGDWE